jgi:addiction module RelE/StbE family toxin
VKLEWLEPALADRLTIFNHIEPENPRAAKALDMQFENAADRALQHPEIGRPGRIAGTRELLVSRRYFLLYQTKGEILEVMAVVHTARQWPPLG